MKKLFSILFLFLFVFVFSQNSLLWKIEGNGLQKPSYLFGTVHMICKNEFQMLDKLQKAINLSEQAYFEIDMGNPNFMSEMQANMMGDKSISSQLSKEDASYISEQLKTKFGTGIEAFDQMKPMIVMSMLMQYSFPCELTSLEGEIIHQLKNEEKLMGGLSSVKEQYNYLDRFVNVKEMVQTIKSLDSEEFKTVFESIKHLYQKEDIVGLDNIMVKYTGANPEMYDILMVERNMIWTERIPEIISKQSTLIAVGSGHLAGEKGLISLLRAKGYQVSPVF
ncbi:TraB/GumN family protein [Faecalibacter rhinopitheci]|uniref:TraB/GumN family protein n=1 Tax=Faecalibacter rhinopitheci TaxID=2779678 RepID=A0A8J7FN91_9FLAO|nr:TraB/GumN family protein [Faecalibacter rhinopitheci]MBF0597562.1 TraB/GumN family protein [Faecalibacter rhinopitheci]